MRAKVFLAVPCGSFTHTKRILVFNNKKRALDFCKKSVRKQSKDFSIEGWYTLQYATVRGG